MPDYSRLVKMRITNFGCIGPEGLEIELDKIIALVGPNNTGKTTVLRAYEAAVTNQQLSENEIYLNAGGQPTTVEIYVHIPAGTKNIDEDWIFIDTEKKLRIVRSKWEWPQAKINPIRKTWNPKINDYAEDAKASGLDAVFSSRLPRPLRIEALAGPDKEHKELLKLILEPIEKALKVLLQDQSSELSKAVSKVKEEAKKPVEKYNDKIQDLTSKLGSSFKQIFPSAELFLKIDMAEIDIRPMELLLNGSQVEIKEKGSQTKLAQQGTGAQRALFWAILQVRSELKKSSDRISFLNKRQEQIPLEIKKKETEKTTLKQKAAIEDRDKQISDLKEELESVNAELSGKTNSSDGADLLAMPGYMLLIDEPEIALHPNTIRAAKDYLYELAEDPGWQVMLSTHSPAFIDPLKDHTTIVRLTRTETHPTPKTYRSDSIEFSKDERENLQMLLDFDLSLAEMFFGSYPVIVEGDTEYIAFLKIMEMFSNNYTAEKKPLLVRAYGKDTIIPIIKILKHFKVPFSLLHDSDSPKNKAGNKNSVWTSNKKIHDELLNTRTSGINVVHRVSIPDFEGQHGLPKQKDDKPYKIFKDIMAKENVKQSIKNVLDQLINNDSPQEPFGDNYEQGLEDAVKTWAKVNDLTEDPHFQFDDGANNGKNTSSVE